MKYHKLAVFFASILLATSSLADVLQLKDGHPDSYVVKKGDTLWDISGVFLRKPWLWPRLWKLNPQVKDPHWIYPGDVLNLVWVNGEPQLVRKKVVRLSPSIKKSVKENPVPTVKLSAIAPFLQYDHVFNQQDDLSSLPYVLGDDQNDKGLIAERHLYVKGALKEGVQYGIYHPGQVYKDKVTGEVLGVEGILAGIAVVGASHPDNVTEVVLTKNMREVMQGDHLMAMPDSALLDSIYYLKPAALKQNGYVVAFPGNHGSVSGQYGVFVLNKGARDGLQNGDVVKLMRPGVELTGNSAKTVAYRQNSTAGQKLMSSDTHRLPDAEVGEAMAFKVYDKVSMAVILRANDMVRTDYVVSNPD